MDVDYGEQYGFEHDLDYQSELVKLAIAGALADRMEALGLTRKQLAERLGVSAGRVTQILASYENLTIRTLVATAIALDTKVSIELTNPISGQAAVPLSLVAHARPQSGEPRPRKLGRG